MTRKISIIIKDKKFWIRIYEDGELVHSSIENEGTEFLESIKKEIRENLITIEEGEFSEEFVYVTREV